MADLSSSQPSSGQARPGTTIVVTGAAGVVGTALAAGLATTLTTPGAPVLGPGPVRLRLCDLPGADVREPDVHGVEVERAHGDLADPAVAESVLAGADAVVHLAGQPRPDAAWEHLLDGNVALTAAVLDAAARRAVRRVVLAGSVHAAGDIGPDGWPLDPAGPARPCCRYGVSKATAELLARDHARARRGRSVVTLRLGLVARRPRWMAEALGWTPLDALAPWVLGALRAPAGYHCVYAVATRDKPARYVTAPATELLGHERRVRPEEIAGLPGERPELAAGCRLWRHEPGDGTP